MALADSSGIGRVNARAIGRLIGGGRGIYWPEVDEDVSVRSLLGGPS